MSDRRARSSGGAKQLFLSSPKHSFLSLVFAGLVLPTLNISVSKTLTKKATEGHAAGMLVGFVGEWLGRELRGPDTDLPLVYSSRTRWRVARRDNVIIQLTCSEVDLSDSWELRKGPEVSTYSVLPHSSS